VLLRREDPPVNRKRQKVHLPCGLSAFTSVASRSWFDASSNRRALNRAAVVFAAYSRRRTASVA